VKLVKVPGDRTSGPGWKWNSGGWVDIDSANTTFAGFDVAGTINVNADGVTVRDCRVRAAGGGGASFGIAIRHAANVIVQHCDISGLKASGGDDRGRLTAGIKDIYGDATGTQVLANDIYDVSCGVQMDSGLIQDNYIHNTASDGTDHVNGVLSSSGGAMIIRHNTIFNQLDQTSAIALYEDFGLQGDKTVDNNLLAGGGYTVYGGGPDHGRGVPTNIRFTANRISTVFWPKGGYYGPVAYFDGTAPGSAWIGNIYDNTGADVTF
jgi:hypothetical protein